MRILAVDPGGTTGIALKDFCCEPFNEAPGTWMPVGFQRTASLLEQKILYDECDLVVCERFTIGPSTRGKSTRGSNEAIELIGLTRYFCSKQDVPFEEQAPADAMSFVPDSRLRMIGWYKTGEDHQRDAMRHCLLAGVRHEVVKPEWLIGGSNEVSDNE